jgi:hypothetical protein
MEIIPESKLTIVHVVFEDVKSRRQMNFKFEETENRLNFPSDEIAMLDG